MGHGNETLGDLLTSSEKSSLFEGYKLSISRPTGEKVSVFGGKVGVGVWVSGCQAPVLKHLL